MTSSILPQTVATSAAFFSTVAFIRMASLPDAVLADILFDDLCVNIGNEGRERLQPIPFKRFPCRIVQEASVEERGKRLDSVQASVVPQDSFGEGLNTFL